MTLNSNHQWLLASVAKCIQRFQTSLIAFVLPSCYSDTVSTRRGGGGALTHHSLAHSLPGPRRVFSTWEWAQTGPGRFLWPGVGLQCSGSEVASDEVEALVGGPQGGPAPGGNTSGRWESPGRCPTSGPQNNVAVKHLWVLHRQTCGQWRSTWRFFSCFLGLSSDSNGLLELLTHYATWLLL